MIGLLGQYLKGLFRHIGCHQQINYPDCIFFSLSGDDNESLEPCVGMHLEAFSRRKRFPIMPGTGYSFSAQRCAVTSAHQEAERPCVSLISATHNSLESNDGIVWVDYNSASLTVPQKFTFVKGEMQYFRKRGFPVQCKALWCDMLLFLQAPTSLNWNGVPPGHFSTFNYRPFLIIG